jgi:hypothetical protein
MRDLLRMSRVVGRLEALPASADLQRIVIVNGPNGYGDMKTVLGDLNISAFFKSWSWAGLTVEAGGWPMTEANGVDVERAAARCRGSGKWPASDSVAIEGELGIACF